MESIRQRQRKNVQNLRKKHREEIMSSKREWFETPSPVFELPYRFQNQQWSEFEQMLDLFGEKQTGLIDEAFKTYLHKEWLTFEDVGWDNEKSFNILRVIFRLQIVEKQHITSILKLALQAKKIYDQSHCESALTVLLKIIKEIAISLQNPQSSNLWQEQTLDCLNFLVSSLQLSRQLVELNNFNYAKLLDEYRIYYIVLLVDRRVSLESFVKIRNVGELYYLINDCICQSDSFQLTKSIQLISKIIKIKGNQEVVKCLNGVSVLLREGIDSSRLFLQGNSYEQTQKGLFFGKFLSILSNSDVVNLLSGIELLALLFDEFDQCIPAAMLIYNKIEHEKEDIDSRIQIIRERQYENFNELIKSLMQNIAYEVRLKVYWLTSNITGSSIHYRQFGLPLIVYIYQNNFLYLERQNQNITNEITICILNYLCNLNEPFDLQPLIQLQNVSTQIDNVTSPNCLTFCLQAATNILQRICLSGDQRNSIYLDENVTNIIHRSVYGLFMVLQHSETHEQMILLLLQRNHCKLTLQKIYASLISHKQYDELCDLTWSVIAKFQRKNIYV